MSQRPEADSGTDGTGTGTGTAGTADGADGAGTDTVDGDLVRAAGCVLWRRAPGGGVEVALVHRPRWDDWSHPKGKLHPGETPADAARREVREETGMDCVLGTSLRAARYRARGRRKEVTYWAAEATDGRFVPNGEVDELRWLPPDEARAQLSHSGNRALLDEALTTLKLP